MSIMDRINAAIERGAPLTLPQIIRKEIDEFKASEAYENIVEAEQYYRNRTEVQNKTNPIKKRSNVKMEHPLYKKLVDQKADYLLAKDFTVESENKAYAKALSDLFDRKFRRKIKSLGKGGVKNGISYLVPYLKDGAVEWMRLPSDEVIPEWADDEHTELDAYIRFHESVEYAAAEKKVVEKVEFWDRTHVSKYRAESVGGVLLPDYDENGEYKYAHLTMDNKPYSWERVPLVWCKYNEEELPLYHFVKDLIDDYNWQTSVTADALRDIAKFIYVIKGYGQADLAGFVKHLQEALAIEVASDGGVDKLEPEVNIDAVMKFLEKNRHDLFDLAAAVDTQYQDLGNASGTAILFRYMGLDTDCANLGAELQETFESMKPFLDFALQISGKGDFSKDTFRVVFNMDMPVNETDIINNCRSSDGLISRRTILTNHPWVKDVDAELKALEEEEQRAMDAFGGGDLFANLNSAQGKQSGGAADGR